jgi:hypothetical protein
MKRQASWFTVVLSLFFLAGCGSAAGPDPEPAPPKPPGDTNPKGFRLDSPIDISLKALLARPRQELAGMAHDLLELVRAEEKSFRQGRQSHGLLPDLRLPLAVPVFRAAAFNPQRGISLPPYLKDGQKDDAVALHLARFGDTEAALRVAQGSANVAQQIQDLRGKNNYPVEWTRGAALHLHLAEARLAAGDSEGARQLIGFHKQLLEILDSKAHSGPLGATLLARGRGALAAAGAAWRQAGRQDLAGQVDAALARWGNVPPLPMSTRPGLGRGAVERLLASAGKGHALRAADNGRAFDLLVLPFPAEDADAVVACFTAADRLGDYWIVYRPHLREIYPYPMQLAKLIDERGFDGKEVADRGGLRRRTYDLGNLVFEITVVPENPTTGAVVHIGPAQPPSGLPALPREYGAVHLDRSFEQNRQRFALHQQGQRLTVARPKKQTNIKNPIPVLDVGERTLERYSGHDVVRCFTWSFAMGSQSLPGLAEMALPLWEEFGTGRLAGEENQAGHHLTLVWEDARTRVVFRVPHEKAEAPLLEVRDRTPKDALAGHAARVAANDRTERQARFGRKKVFFRLPRARENIRLGMTRGEVRDALPNGEGVVAREIPGGLGVVLRGAPEEGAPHVAREIFVRFGPEDRAAEIRVRYANFHDLRKLLTKISRRGGAPAEGPGPWARVWTPPFARRKPAPLLYSWHDDVTWVTCQRDSEGLELTLRDCPLEHPEGVPLPPFRCLPLGPGACRLGMTKASLLKEYNASQAEFHQGVLVLLPPKGPYDQIFVRFDQRGTATQITARYKRTLGSAGPAEMAAAVRQAWGEMVEELGWPRREDHDRRKQLQSWANHDDVARVCIFWQPSRSAGPKLYTEWKRLGP